MQLNIILSIKLQFELEDATQPSHLLSYFETSERLQSMRDHQPLTDDVDYDDDDGDYVDFK